MPHAIPDVIQPIDCHYLGRPETAAAYLLVDGERAAFVDNNTAHALPHLLRALADAGLHPEQVAYLVITHVHLDHAAGTAALAAQCPNAVILAHPRAAPHLVDPSRLVASAAQVYGEEAFARLYGVVEPVPAARVRTVEDDEVLPFGSRTWRFLHTRGHANHHMCLLDVTADAVIAGDAFGLQYPALQGAGTFAVPSTSPTDFDAALARESVERIVATGASQVYVSHFGRVADLHESAGQLLRHLEFAGELVDEATRADLSEDGIEGWIAPRYRAYVRGLLEARSPVLASRPETWALLEMDLALNTQGIAFAAIRNRRRQQGG
jgi:glyoxylase-like metal-dependent hydrolase (beta-lactamase superfamily II)